MRGAVLSGLLASVALFGAGGAAAQNSLVVDRLINRSADIIPMAGIDTETRAGKRYAVVIGNGDYAAIPDLENARTDAAAVADYLRRYGYLVSQYDDLDKRGFEDMLRRILFDVDENTEVVIFYAGHGFQIGADNYLVPVDADLDTIYDVPFEAVSLGSLVGIVGARARLQIVILDSCRDNPFAGREVLTQVGDTLRTARTGFSSQAAPLNSMLVYSTSPGALAYDGDGPNSPFTASLIEEASDHADERVKDVFELVRARTVERTSGRQVPWDSSTLVEPVSFGLGAALRRPVALGKRGMRGTARLLTEIEDQPDRVLQAVMETGTVVEADFVPEVNIGPALVEALGLSGDATMTLTDGPETGHLMREDLTGLRREVTGQSLDAAAVRELVLVNKSVQIPARTLEDGIITDVFSVTVNGEARQVSLKLVPDACDFEAGDHLDPDGMGITRYPNEIAPARALEACRASVERDPEEGRFHSQLGRAYLALGDRDSAQQSFEAARQLGHARAWQELGLLARYAERGIGNSGTADSDAVRALFARGVAEGDPYAMHTLGYELLTNGGDTESEVAGYDLMIRAMEVGHTFAMNALTGIYLNEASEYHDPERALRYMRESVAREDIYGYHNLGLAYAKGQAGLEVDAARAVELLTAAAEGGHPGAPQSLAAMYADGTAPGGADPTEAVRWYAAGVERGDAFAGAMGAFTILSGGVEGYDVYDAAVLAAKGAALTRNRNAGAALQQVQAMSPEILNGGAQKLIRALGGETGVDGDWGPGSSEALDAVLTALDGGPAATDPEGRILQLAALYWQVSPLRVDLY